MVLSHHLKDLSFEGLEAISYTPETLVSALTQIRNSSKKAVRCVLGEELVYVTSFSLPKTTEINREKVLHIAEKSIPENLKDTAWDFQTLEYNETPISETTTMIQIAVVEKVFLLKISLMPSVQTVFFQNLFSQSHAPLLILFLI